MSAEVISSSAITSASAASRSCAVCRGSGFDASTLWDRTRRSEEPPPLPGISRCPNIKPHTTAGSSNATPAVAERRTRAATARIGTARPTQGRKVSSRLPRLPIEFGTQRWKRRGNADSTASTAITQPRRHMLPFRRRRAEARDGGFRLATAVWRSDMVRFLRTHRPDQSPRPVRDAFSSLRRTDPTEMISPWCVGLDPPDNAGMPAAQTKQPFVVKRLGTTRTMLYVGTVLFGLEILLTLLCVVVALIKDEPVREPLETLWLSWGGMPLIFAVGLPVLLLVGLVTTAEERHEPDQDDVLLSINEAGVYLG